MSTLLITYEVPTEDIDVRCQNCGSLIARRAELTQGHIEIKCKCKAINRISFK